MWYENPAWYAFALSVIALFYTVYDRRGTKNEGRLKAFESALQTKANVLELAHVTECVDALEERTTKIEAHMQHLPSKDASHRLEIALAKMEGEMSTLAERIKPIAAMSARLQEKLIENIGGA